MSSKAQRRATKKYDKANVIRLNLKLNKKTNSHIIERLEDESARKGYSKQGYVKYLIEQDIERDAKPYRNFEKLLENASLDEVALLLSHNKMESGCLHCADNPDGCEQECFTGIRNWLMKEVDKE